MADVPSEVYVEFPVDLIVNVHWPKKDDGGGGGEPPTHPCGGDAFTMTGAFPVNDNGDWILVGGVVGVNLSDPDTFPGIRILADVTIGGGATEGHVVYPGVGPPQISQRPAYTNHGCGFDIGVSTDGVGFSVTASTGDVSVAEGDAGSVGSASATVGPAPPGETLYIGVRSHGGSMDSNVHFLLIFVGGGFVNVGVNVAYTCTGPAPSEAHEHPPFVPDDQLAPGLTRVAA